MADIIDTLHPENSMSDNFYPNIKKENIPNKSIDTSKLDDNVLSMIGSLSPTGTDTSANILAKTADDGIWVGTDTGDWYYWNGTQYVSGGDYLTSNIVSGRSGYILIGRLDIDTTNLTITSTNVQYNTNDYVYNIGLTNQNVSYNSNAHPIYIFFNKQNNTINAYDLITQATDLHNAQNNSNMYLIAILYNKNLTFTLSGNYIYIDGTKFNAKIVNDNMLSIGGKYCSIFLGELNINTTNKTIASTSIQYNTNDYTYNIALTNQAVSYSYNEHPQFIYFDRQNNTINVYDIISDVAALYAAQTNPKMYLVAILYNKSLTFTLSGNYIYINNVKFDEIITNRALATNDNVNTATHYPFVKYSSTASGLYQKALFNIWFDNYTTTNLSLRAIYRNKLTGNNRVYAVVLYNLDSNTEIQVLNVLASTYTEKTRNEFNTNGFRGYFDIDWSVIPDDTWQIFNNDMPKILPICFNKNIENLDISVPSSIPVVINREIRLEYYNMFKCNNIETFSVINSTNSSQFENLQNALKIKTTSAGNTNESIYLTDDRVRLVGSSFTIKSVDDTTKPNIKAIFIGDSFTEMGYYLAELKTLMGNSLTLYGTRSSTRENSLNENVTTNHEGRGGWSSSTYVNNASRGDVTNPFYNNGFDFSYYISNNSTFSDVTDVFILLGQNDYGDAFITNIQTMCNSIKSYNSNIKIHIMLPTPPVRSGYAWGIRNYSNVLSHKNSMFNYCKQLISAFDGVSGYTVIATNLNVDCWYDFPKTQVAANMRNPELITVGNDNVHPNKYGMYRLSDMVYADIIANS